jgi:hypothetical protein
MSNAAAGTPQRVWLLVASSCGFLAPLYLLQAHWHANWVSAALAALAVLTCVFSIVTWYDRAKGHWARRDKLVARLSGAIFTAVGLTVIPPAVLVSTGFPLWFVMLGLYGLSRVANRHEVHCAFHVAVASGMCLICHHLVHPEPLLSASSTAAHRADMG